MSSTPSRLLCPDCLRPARACICAWAVPTANQTDVLLLQHPLETAHAKNSLTLLRLSLARHTVAVGEAFPPDQLQSLLHGPAPGKAQPMLLYPEAPGVASFLPDPDGLPPRLVVLDATWRKSLSLIHI